MTRYEWFAISALACGLIVSPLKKLDGRRKRRLARYTEDFHSHDEGEIALMSLTQRPLHVRYNPEAPSEYLMDPYKDF